MPAGSVNEQGELDRESLWRALESRVPLAVFDTALCLRSVTAAFVAMSGLALAGKEAAPAEDLLPLPLVAALRDVLRTGDDALDLAPGSTDCRLDGFAVLGGDGAIAGVALLASPRAAEADRASAALAAIVTSSPYAVISTDPSGRIRTWNAAAERLHGFTAAEAIGQPIASLAAAPIAGIGPHDGERLRAGEPLPPFEATAIRKDGTKVEVHVTVAPIRDATGKLSGLSVVSRDISAERAAELRLAESEERYRTLANTIPDVVTLVRADGGVEYANAAALAYYKRPLEKLTRAWMRSAVDPADETILQEAGSQIWEQGVQTTFEVRTRTETGTYRWRQITAVPMVRDDGHVEKAVLISRDVHEEKTAALRVAESEQRYRTLAESLPDLVFVSRSDNVIEYANTRALQYLGVSPEGLTSPDFARTLHPDDRDVALRARSDGWQRMEPSTIECRLRRADGEYRWHVSHTVPMAGPEGALDRRLSICTDIHDQKVADERLAASEVEYRTLAEALPDLVIVVNSAGGVEFANRAALSYFAMTVDEIRHARYFDYIHPDDRARTREARLAAIEAGGVASTLECRFRSGAGEYRWHMIESVPLSGERARRLTVATDIHDRKIAQDRLRAEFQLLRDVTDSLAAFVGLMTPDGILIEANSTALAAANLQPGDVLGRPLDETYWWNFGGPGRQRLREAIATAAAGQSVQYDDTIRLADDRFTTIEFRVVPLFASDGTVRYLVPSGIDVQARVDVAERLAHSLDEQAESRALLETLIGNAPLGVAFLDNELRYRVVNRALAAIDGLPVEEHLGRGFAEILPSLPAHVIEGMREVLRTGVPMIEHPVSAVVPASPSEPRELLLSCYPVEAGGARIGAGLLLAEVTERVRTEQALRMSEERYRTLNNVLPQKVWTTTPEGAADYFNEVWETYTGLSGRQSASYGWTAVVHPDDLAETLDRWAVSLQAGEPLEVEHRLRRWDGEYRWHLVRALALRNAAGEILSWFGTSTDVHEQRLLQDREELLARVTTELNQTLDLDGTLQRVAGTAIPLLGDFAMVDLLEDGRIRRVAAAHRDPSRAAAMRQLLAFAPDVGAEHHPAARALRTGELEVTEGMDPQRWIETSGLTGEQAELTIQLDARARLVVPMRVPGRVVGTITFARSGVGARYPDETVKLAEEVAERAALAVANAQLFRQAQDALEALRRSEEEQRTLIDTVPQLVWVGDATGKVLSANRVWHEYTGVDDVDRALDPVHPEEQEQMRAFAREGAATAEPWELEHRMRRHDGVYRWFLARSVPLRDARGAVRGWLGTSTDITSQKEAQAALLEASQVKDEFLGMVSHELRTPLTMIGGHAGSLLRHGARIDNETRESSLQDIVAQSDRLQRLVENMLALSIVGSKNEVVTEPLLLQHLIPRVVAVHRQYFPARSVVLNIPRDLPVVNGQSTYVDQVVQNLVSNAEKYSPPLAPIEIVAEAKDDAVAVRVLDQGSGFSANEADEIFKPFFRLERTSRSVSGAGLGLAVCQRLIEAMGGRIWAAPRPEGGAEFGFELPIEPE